MSHRKTGSHAVLLATVDPGWQPTHFGTMPPLIASTRWYARKLHLHEAVAIVRTFNTQRLQGRTDGQWLLLVVHPRSCGRYIGRVESRLRKEVRS